MADTDKDLIITPNIGENNDTLPQIEFSAADATSGPTKFFMKTDPSNGSTISIDAGAGQLWQIKEAVEGKIFSVTSPTGYEAMVIEDTGQVSFAPTRGRLQIPSRPAFRVRNTTSANAFSADAVATWNVVDYNNYNCFNSGNRFTAPHDGIYHFSCMMLSNSGTRLFTRFKINGNDVFGTWSESYSLSDYQTNTITMTVPLNKNDFVQVYLRINNGYGSNYANFNGMQVG